jgi:solute:Na+ symporter, SSS family
VVLLYGFFINLNNFGMDQNYVQRYHSTTSAAEARRSIWLCVGLYLPASLLFFIIGTCLYAYYQTHPDLLDAVKWQTAQNMLPTGSIEQIKTLANSLQAADYGDKVMPHFMVNKIPIGLMGLIISALLSAAMSTISSGMNASATVFSIDIYQRYIKKSTTEKQKMRVLYIATVAFGLLGMGTGIAMIGVKSVLDVWWQLSGIFSAGMLGLFLLGFISQKTNSQTALLATVSGILVIFWLTFSPKWPMGTFKNLLHTNMTIVVGVLSIFIVGVLLTKLKRRN